MHATLVPFSRVLSDAPDQLLLSPQISAKR